MSRIYVLVGANDEPLESASGAVFAFASYCDAADAAGAVGGRVKELDPDAPSQEDYDECATALEEAEERLTGLERAWLALVGGNAYDMAAPDELASVAREQARKAMLTELGISVGDDLWYKYLEGVQP